MLLHESLTRITSVLKEASLKAFEGTVNLIDFLNSASSDSSDDPILCSLPPELEMHIKMSEHLRRTEELSKHTIKQKQLAYSRLIAESEARERAQNEFRAREIAREDAEALERKQEIENEDEDQDIEEYFIDDD